MCNATTAPEEGFLLHIDQPCLGPHTCIAINMRAYSGRHCVGTYDWRMLKHSRRRFVDHDFLPSVGPLRLVFTHTPLPACQHKNLAPEQLPQELWLLVLEFSCGAPQITVTA